MNNLANAIMLGYKTFGMPALTLLFVLQFYNVFFYDIWLEERTKGEGKREAESAQLRR